MSYSNHNILNIEPSNSSFVSLKYILTLGEVVIDDIEVVIFVNIDQKFVISTNPALYIPKPVTIYYN